MTDKADPQRVMRRYWLTLGYIAGIGTASFGLQLVQFLKEAVK